MFEKMFRQSQGKPIVYNGETIFRYDAINVNKHFSGIIKLNAASSVWRQGIKLKVDNFLIIDETKRNEMALWADYFKNDIPFYGETNNGLLYINNIWDTGNGVIESWYNGAAMKKKVLTFNHIRYFCNDGHPNDDFSDIVFEIVLDREPVMDRSKLPSCWYIE